MTQEEASQLQCISKIILKKLSNNRTLIKRYIGEVIRRKSITECYNNALLLEEVYISHKQKQDCLSRLKNFRIYLFKEI